MRFLSGARVKWLAYSLELFLLYIMQYTPNLLPSFLGVQPLPLIVAAISIAIFEGESAGMWFGLAAGLLMDLGSVSVFGFYGILCMAICYAGGLLVVRLMRANLLTAMLQGAGGLLIIGLCQWFFFYAIWGTSSGVFLYAIMLPQMLYTALLMPIFYYFNRAVSTRI